jgi:hypothetical protein
MTSVAQAPEIDWRQGAPSDDCVICLIQQTVQIEPRPEGVGHVLNFLLFLTIDEPEAYTFPTGVEFKVLMSSKECADLDLMADFVDRDTGETTLGYRAYASQYYRTAVLEKLPKKICDCACNKE